MDSENNNNNNNNNEDFNFLMKLLIIGDSGVGKSSILLRFCEDTFSSNFLSTIGIDFKVKYVHVDNMNIKMQIWDTAGQERFRTITKAYYRGAQGIFMVYDTTNVETFKSITSSWIKNVDQHASLDVCKILIGNKIDLESEKKVTTSEGMNMAEELGIEFFETSAKVNKGIEESFMSLAKCVKNKYVQMGEIEKTKVNELGVSLTDVDGKKKCGGCK